jgi:DNA polymerase V
METIHTLLPRECIEVYSIDEAFLDLSHVAPGKLATVAKHIKDTVEQWTGIAVSIGVAPTKTLAKLANRFGKKNPKRQGVVVLDTPEKVTAALQHTEVGDIWGVGNRKALKLQEMGITDAWQLKQMPEEWMRKNLGGVVGVRLLKELRGEPCIQLDEQREKKKMITTTRMFGCQVTEIKYVKEAVATYVSRAAEKLRRQKSAAKVLTVFVVPKEEGENIKYRHGPTETAYVVLPAATSSTNDLIKPAMDLVDKLFKENKIYKKAGVILSELEPDTSIQSNLYVPARKNETRYLMDMIDNLNFSMRDDIIKFGSAGTEKNWKMRQELRSPRYTTRWNELPKVN